MGSEIIRKLKLDGYKRGVVLNMPDGFKELDGLKLEREYSDAKHDLIIVFVFSMDEMSAVVQDVAKNSRLDTGGYLFFAYPKKGNKKYDSYIHRDSIMPHLNVSDEDGFVPGTPLKFSRMVSMDDVFTVVGLKCVMPK